MQNHFLQGLVSLPRASAFDPRIAKTGETPRTEGDDGKLYVKLDSRDQHRFHVLTDEQMDEEKCRNDTIKAVLAKSTGGLRPSSAPSGSKSRPNAAHTTNITAAKASPGRPPTGVRQHAARTNSSSSGSSSSKSNGGSGATTVAATIPTITEIFDADAPNNAMEALKTDYEHNLDVIDQLYKEKRSLESRVRSLEFQADYPHSRAMISGAQDLRTSSSAALSAFSAASPTKARGRGISVEPVRRSRDFSPVVTVVDALHLKNEQNRGVIHRLAAEKRELKSRARHLEMQILHPWGTKQGIRHAAAGYGLVVDGDGDTLRCIAKHSQSAPTSPTHARPSPPTRTRLSASCEVKLQGEDPEGIHWEVHVDPTTAEVYYYNAKTGQIQLERSVGPQATRAMSTEPPKVFEISSQLQVDLLIFKQRQIDMKVREDQSRYEQKEYEDFVSDRFLKVRYEE